MKRTQHDECRAPQAAGTGDGQLPFEGKEVHIEGYTPEDKK